MKLEEIEKLEEFFQPLIEEFDEKLKSVILTGSAVRKERVEGSDIDILVILDDHIDNYDKNDKKKVNRALKEIEEEAKDEDYDLHIQPPKTVSGWYSLLLNGRPWAVTSMIHSQPIYDPDDFQQTTQRMIKSTKPQSTHRRAEKLDQEVREHVETAEKKLEDGFINILENVRKSAKALLKYREDSLISDEELDKRFKEFFGERIDPEKYQKLRKTMEKIKRGEQEPSFEKLEDFSDNALNLIKQLQKSFESELDEFQKQLLNQTLKEIKESCKVLLEEKDIEYDEEEVFEKFRDEFIEKGVLSEDYWKLIERTQELKNESQEVNEESIYHSIAGSREFETAVNSIIERDLFESFELQSDSEKARITPINEYEEKILEEFEDNIKGIYVLSTEHLLETESATVVILIDSEENEIKNLANKVEVEIGREQGFNIHTKVELITDYWKGLQNGDEELIYEIKSCIVSYDPNGLLESTQKLVDQGKLPGTIPEIKKSITRHTLKSIVPVKKVKKDCLKEYYSASIKMGQAELLKQGITPPVQKKVPEVLEEAPEDTEITEKDIETIQEVINTFKQTEYGNIENLEARKLDKLKNNLRKIDGKN